MISNINAQHVSQTFAEGQRYFMGEGKLNNALERLSHDLRDHDIDYMVIGAIALLAHGYPRFTENIDLVMTSEGRQRFNDELKRLRSTIDGVSIEVMTTGEFPGDGKPKPVSMPRPSEASIEIDGIRFVTLEKLIELKLASGMSAPDRLKDLADVQELIKLKHLDADFALKLDPYVRPKYLELEAAVRRNNEHTE